MRRPYLDDDADNGVDETLFDSHLEELAEDCILLGLSGNDTIDDINLEKQIEQTYRPCKLLQF